jgi:hypothetical protein
MARLRRRLVLAVFARGLFERAVFERAVFDRGLSVWANFFFWVLASSRARARWTMMAGSPSGIW